MIDNYHHKIIQGDALAVLKTMPSEAFQCVITSPPYWGLRNYQHAGAEQWGLESTPQEHVLKLVVLFRQVWRVLRSDGIVWLNYGVKYAGSQLAQCERRVGNDRLGFPTADKTKKHPDSPVMASLDADADVVLQEIAQCLGLMFKKVRPKNLLMLGHALAFALQMDGWFLRSDTIWQKTNCMPEAVKDRPCSAHEDIFMLTKNGQYFHEFYAVRTPSKSNDSAKSYAKLTDRKRSVNEGNEGAYNTRRKEFEALYGDIPSTAQIRSVWTISPAQFPGAHYAVFPDDLVKMCLLASTPKHGYCKICKQPIRILTKPHQKNGAYGKPEQRDGSFSPSVGRTTPLTPYFKVAQTGLACGCKKTPTKSDAPVLVLDPFAGSGTVLAVAAQHGRVGIGIDLAGGKCDLGGFTPHERIEAAKRGLTPHNLKTSAVHHARCEQAGQVALFERSE